MEYTSKNHEAAQYVAVATTTKYDINSKVGKVRAKLALQTVKSFCDLGAEVYVVDDSSSDRFFNELKSTGAHVYHENFFKGKHSMGKSKRQALKLACSGGRKVILWTEPEKTCLPNQLYKIAEPILNNSAEIIIPDRRPLCTYPISQQYAENLGNAYWKEVTGTDLDIYGGVRVIKNKTEAISNFLNYKGKYGDLWEGLYVPVIQTIIAKKERVVGIKIDYIHPKVQTEIEEGNPRFTEKRLAQLNNLSLTFKKSWEDLMFSIHSKIKPSLRP